MNDSSASVQTGASHASFSSVAVQGREDALRRLAEIADFFRKTEPHSPLANAIERAVRWGRMPLHELLFELLPDKSARATYAQLTGVQIGAGGEFVPPPVVETQEEEEETPARW